jgi:hypothetical protein
LSGALRPATAGSTPSLSGRSPTDLTPEVLRDELRRFRAMSHRHMDRPGGASRPCRPQSGHWIEADAIDGMAGMTN